MLFDMMQTRTAIRPGARAFGGAVLLLFVLAAFAPLGSALAQCAMPCCHHGSAGSSLDGASPCPVERCTISSAPETAATLAPAVSPADASVVMVAFDDLVPPASTSADNVHQVNATTPPRALHVLNSVFRI